MREMFYNILKREYSWEIPDATIDILSNTELVSVINDWESTTREVRLCKETLSSRLKGLT